MKKIILISVLILALSLPMFAKGVYVNSRSKTAKVTANQTAVSQNQLSNFEKDKKIVDILENIKLKPSDTLDDVNPSEPIVNPIIKPEIDIPIIDPVPAQPAIEQVRGQKASSNSPYAYGLPENTTENGLSKSLAKLTSGMKINSSKNNIITFSGGTVGQIYGSKNSASANKRNKAIRN